MDLFTPVTLGDLELANRVVMAPLTRLRSGASGVPGDLVVEYYRQRASAGLIIAEGTYVNHESQAFVGQPGIVTGEQVAGWRRVAEAVLSGSLLASCAVVLIASGCGESVQGTATPDIDREDPLVVIETAL
ncbi:oxidoreductase, partial [Rhodococcus sp. YH1]|uniref:oxidoreductase n=1 Tax=Rhodococcus sp. YH1 TaxID=89066 RepID=UPI003FD54ECA